MEEASSGLRRMLELEWQVSQALSRSCGREQRGLRLSYTDE